MTGRTIPGKPDNLTDGLGQGATSNVMSVNTENQTCLTKEQVVKDYPDVFLGTGNLEGQYKLEVEEGAKRVVHPPRRVLVEPKGKLKQELDRTKPWNHRESHKTYPVDFKRCNPVQKPIGQIRVCNDPKTSTEF